MKIYIKGDEYVIKIRKTKEEKKRAIAKKKKNEARNRKFVLPTLDKAEPIIQSNIEGLYIDVKEAEENKRKQKEILSWSTKFPDKRLENNKKKKIR